MVDLRGLRRERALASKQHRDGKFRNPTGRKQGLKGNPLPVLGEFFFGGRQRVPDVTLPIEDPRERWLRPADSGFRMTWLGHSTVLLELDGLRVLTDPVFGARASPFSFAGPKRFHPVPVRLDELPALDAVLLSHDHYDHLCRDTITQLGRRGVPIVTSLGVGARLEALGVAPDKVVELDWWESQALGGLRFHATPAQHFSGRTVGDANQTLWSSWVIESENRRVFFSGDTGLEPEFPQIGSRFGRFDLVMLEIGAFNVAWGDIHLGPEQALTAFDQLGGGTLFPVHWGTFDLALHAWDEPPETLLARAGDRRIITPRLGQVVEPVQLEGPTPWWRGLGAEDPARRLVAEPGPG